MVPRIGYIALAALGLVSTAAGAAPAGLELEIEGRVPTVCRAEVRGNLAAPEAGTHALGTLDEYCNNPGGYEVHVLSSPELAGAKLVVDGVEIPLSASGPVLVSRSDHADIATHSLELQLPDGRASPNGILSFRIAPL